MDASCGDFHWMSQVDFGAVSYIGIDIVLEIIAKSAGVWRPGRKFIHCDITVGPLPPANMVTLPGLPDAPGVGGNLSRIG